MSDTIATAYVQIIPSTEGIKGNLESALSGEATSAGQSAGSKFGSAFGTATKVGLGAVTALGTAAAGAGTALYKTASAVAEAGDNIDKMSQKMGVSSTFYQEWDAVLQHSGTSMDSMTATFKKLATASQNTTKDQAAAFEALGMSLEDVSKMSTEDLFTNVITQLQGMEEGTERTALATTLLGKGAMEMGALLNTSASDTQIMINEVNRLGGVLSEDAVKNAAAFQDQLQDMGTAFEGIKNKAMSEFLPGITSVMGGITELMAGGEDASYLLEDGITQIVQKITESVPQLMEVFETISSAIIKVAPDLLKSLADGLIEALPQIIPELTELVLDIGQKLIELFPQLAECAVELILQLANGIAEALPTLIPTIVDVVLMIVDTLINNIDLLIDGAIALVLGLTEGIINALPRLIERIPEIVLKLVEALIANAPKLQKASIALMLELASGLISAIPKLIKAGAEIVAGLWTGIKNAWTKLVENVKHLASNLVEALKSFFKIGSPSKLMSDEIGKWIPEGVSVGIDANADSPIKSLGSMADDMTSTLQSQIASDVSVNPIYSASSLEIANNDNQGIMDLMSQYLPQMANNSVNISLEGDAAGLFNAVRKQDNIFSKANGRSAFA